MTLKLAFKIFKALFLFIREMWLRDRTFRQFVHDNLALIITGTGFVIMTILFTFLFTVVRSQEVTLAKKEIEYIALKEEYERSTAVLLGRVDWYRDRYHDLLQQKNPQPATRKQEQPEAREETVSPLPERRIPTIPPSQPAQHHRTHSTDIMERWNRLNR